MQPTTQTVTKPAARNLISALREEAAKNPVFNSVCLVFSMRERTRQQITIPSLMVTMDKEKFSFSKEELAKVLRFLSGLGIGTLEHDRSGKVTALKNIKVTLQSIGLSALSKKEGLDKFQAQPQFQSLVADQASKAPVPTKTVQIPHAGTTDNTNRFPASLTVKIEGKPVVFDIPHGISLKDLSAVLQDLYKKAVV